MADRPGEGYIIRHQDFARSYFGVRSGEPLHEVAPELTLAIILENDRAENFALQHTFPWSSGVVPVAAAVGNVNQLQIINPVSSGIVVIVQGMKLAGKVTVGTIIITLDGALIGAGQAPNISLDSRAKVVAAQPVVASLNAISNATVGVNGVQVDRAFSPFNVVGDVESQLVRVRHIILTPGHRASIWNLTPNEASNFVAWGYERPMESTELVAR